MIFYALIGIPINGIVMVTLGDFFGKKVRLALETRMFRMLRLSICSLLKFTIDGNHQKWNTILRD